MIIRSLSRGPHGGRTPLRLLAGGGALALALAACGNAAGAVGTGSGPGAASLAPLSYPAGASSAASLQGQYVATVDKVLPSVVQLQTTQGLGSGVVFDSKGDIVTNNHVVGGATTLQVTASNGKTYNATVVGTYPADDLAVVHVSGANLTPAAFGNSAQLHVGDIVMAVGNPLGLSSSVTEGIVSSLGRTEDEGNGVVIPNMIQTSAAINPGNSGGALVDLSGQVVGIPTLAATDPQLGGSAPGIGFAIPSSTVVSIANQIVKTGHVTNSGRAYMGVELTDSFAGSGSTIAQVTPGSPAAKAGLQAGDVITSVNGTQVANTAALVDLVAGFEPGQTVTVGYTDLNGNSKTVQVTLGQLPSSLP